MKYFCISIALFLFLFVFSVAAYACTSNEFPVNGVYYTSGFCWASGDGYITISGASQKNDTVRLQRAISTAYGKLIFDENIYFINSTLEIDHPFLILEGNGRSTNYPGSFPYTPTGSDGSKIFQMQSDKSIFKIGEKIFSITIRDMGLVGGPSKTGTIGILAEGGPTGNRSSFAIQFTNLTFESLHKGIYVNSKATPSPAPTPPPNPPGSPTPTPYPVVSEGQWQFDNVRLDHAMFSNCHIGVHINSNNSGWSMSSLVFAVPPDIAGEGVENETWGVYLERSSYTNMSLLIGNGQPAGGVKPTGFIRINHHANVTIENATDEPGTFTYSLWTGYPFTEYEGSNLYMNVPVKVSNSFFGNEVKIDNTHYVSSANQYGGNGVKIPVNATGDSQVHSFGDKFCFEEDEPCTIGGVDYSNFKLHDNAKLITSSTKKGALFGVPVVAPLDVAGPYGSGDPLFSVMATDYAPTLMRLGRTAYWFDFTRSEYTGALEIHGNQTCCNAVKFIVGTSTEVTVNTDGSVTYGSTTYSSLGSSTNGTVIYCSNCTKATPCGSGGSGALAKRINSAWDCD